jgi:two-component system sensor histidine kinase CiaH
MFRSATVKLTMSYLAIAMAISILFSIILYNATTSELHRGLNAEGTHLYSEFPVFQGDPRFNFATKPYYEDSSHRILLSLVGFNLIVLVGAGFTSYWLARRTLAPIEAAHEQQKRFTADVSHELRTPLTAIRSESEVALLSKNAAAKDLRSVIKSNIEETTKLEALINNLFRLTRLDAGELKQQFKLVHGRDTMSEAIEAVDKAASAKSIKINRENEAATEVKGDKESLVQLLTILLDNAIKYSPKGSQISLSSEKIDDRVIWRIKDEGHGISPKALPNVFDRFYREDNSRSKSQTEGFGLGLSIAKMIADLHGANITLESQQDQGTVATVSLPAA